jgi:hypothetical protein
MVLFLLLERQERFDMCPAAWLALDPEPSPQTLHTLAHANETEMILLAHHLAGVEPLAVI